MWTQRRKSDWNLPQEQKWLVALWATWVGNSVQWSLQFGVQSTARRLGKSQKCCWACQVAAAATGLDKRAILGLLAAGATDFHFSKASRHPVGLTSQGLWQRRSDIVVPYIYIYTHIHTHTHARAHTHTHTHTHSGTSNNGHSN
jgi:hypothetical protein